jgi:hypothetical protein
LARAKLGTSDAIARCIPLFFAKCLKIEHRDNFTLIRF